MQPPKDYSNNVNRSFQNEKWNSKKLILQANLKDTLGNGFAVTVHAVNVKLILCVCVYIYIYICVCVCVCVCVYCIYTYEILKIYL